MTALDLRSVQQNDHRETLFGRLDDTDTGATVELITDETVPMLLHHYQIKRGHDLQWESEQRAGGELAIQVTKGEPVGETGLVEFDVRDMPPQQRHEVLTDTFDDLEPGEGFVLVNDHDPKPLYHELRSTRGEVFEWEYTNRDPQEWRVEVRKTAETEEEGSDVAASFDVREIPKQERHPTIHHRYGNIVDGETMEIVASHEPRPLRREFRERYGESFAWEVVESEPGRCRVRITKGARAKEGTTDTTATSSASRSLDRTEKLDVRDLPPAERHEQIFQAYDDLGTGEAFTLVNDHDPKPLYHQFDAEAGDEFSWEYLQQEPGEFRVLVGKDGTTDGGRNPDEDTGAPF